jgi:hypothetical protein
MQAFFLNKELSQQNPFKKPAFHCQLAGMLEHICSQGQMVDSAIAGIRKIELQEFVKTGLANSIGCATLRTFIQDRSASVEWK